jgi:hypothetical protein
MSTNKKETIRVELTYGQVVLVPNLTNVKESKLSNGAIYRLLDMSFVRVLNPLLPDKPDLKEMYVMRLDSNQKQFIFETKNQLYDAMMKRIKEHPDFSKGLKTLL